MSRNINPRPQYLDDAGDPLVSGKLHIFESGTDTPKDTFADVNLSILNTNPIILTADGRLPNMFYNGAGRQKLTDSDDVQIWDIDPVGGDDLGANFSEWNPLVLYSMSFIVVGSDGLFYKSITDGNINNDPTTSPAEWEQIEFISVWNTNVTYGIGSTVKGSDNLFYSSLVTPNIGNDPVGDIVNWGAPFSPNLTDPGPIGSVTPDTGDFTDLTADTIVAGEIQAGEIRSDIIGFQASRGGAQTGIADSVFTKVEFNVEVFDPQGDYDHVTNFRYTPQIPGVYRAKIGLLLAGSVSLDDEKGQIPTIYKNGVAVNVARSQQNASGTSSQHFAVEALIEMNGSTDFLEGFVLMNVPSGTGSVVTLQSVFEANYEGEL